jgi:thiamine biosynthesis lipoprotein
VTGFASTTFAALGTSATVVVAHERALDQVVSIARQEIDAMDRACSRFRPDSELVVVNSSPGRSRAVSPLFLEALRTALRAAEITGGRVVPTVGRALRTIGYDRDFAALDPTGPPLRVGMSTVPGWQAVSVDVDRSTVTVPAGVELDFGATAKALCADRAAYRGARVTGTGVLVSLGGDISVAGTAPEGGWSVQLSDHHADRLGATSTRVGLISGGLATSSTSVRRWSRGGQMLHHLIDPATGAPAAEFWRTVTVAAATCVDANIASCASIILGPAAPAWLAERALPARLTATSGAVTTTSGWVADLGGVEAEPVGPTRVRC